jgi:uncharacterized membrane protein
VLGLLLILAPATPASAKDYGFPLVEIDATVLPDGSLDLVERRTFEFSGSFSEGFFTIDWPFARIQGFAVRDGRDDLLVSETGRGTDTFEASWFFSATDEQRTFTISYRVLCAVDVYADTAHLLWMFIGEGWERPTDLARITVHLPGAAVERQARLPSCTSIFVEGAPPFRTRPLEQGETLAWGHGPLSGEVRFLDPQTVVLEVRDLPAFQFVEGSVLFPPAVVPNAVQQPVDRRAEILAEEQDLAGAANRLRLQHTVETNLVRVLFGLVPLLMLLLVLRAYRRDRVPEIPALLQEPPEDAHPAELALLWSANKKRLSPKNAYRAQLLHLAHKGVIEVSAIGRVSDPEDFTIRLRGQPEGVDARFVSFLFGEEVVVGDGQKTVLLSEVKAKGERATLLSGWWDEVADEMKPTIKEIDKGRSRRESKLAFWLAAGTAAYGIWRWTGFDESWRAVGLVGPLAGWLVPIGVLGWLVSSRVMRPHVSEGLKRRLAGWRAFHRFLETFSTLDEAPALAVVIWERYLVYAAALGVADEVEKQVRAIIPAEELPQPWQGAPTGSHGFSWYRSWSGAPSYTTSTAAKAVGWSGGWGGLSSRGGGGGGFSGGGGGGGGGTGGGAR